LRTPKEPEAKPEVNDIALKGQSDTWSERPRSPIVKVVDVGRVINTSELAAREEIANVEFFSVGVDSNIENIQDATNADLLFIIVDSDDEAATCVACTLAKAAKFMGALVFSVALSRSGQLNDDFPETLASLETETDALFVMPPESEAFSPECNSKAFTDVLHVLLRYVTNLLAPEMIIGVDFDEFKAVFTGAGRIFLGIGTGEGSERAVLAAREALDNPVTVRSPANFRKVLVCLEGDDSLTFSEMKRTLEIIAETSEAITIIWGNIVNSDMGDAMKVIVIAA
jgi:cell division protein FtsZ